MNSVIIIKKNYIGTIFAVAYTVSSWTDAVLHTCWREDILKVGSNDSTEPLCLSRLSFGCSVYNLFGYYFNRELNCKTAAFRGDY